MTEETALAVSSALESLLVANNHRGMQDVQSTLTPGYLLRAAHLIRRCTGRVYILTGFPVAGTFETDGPAGAMALYQLLEQRGAQPDDSVRRINHRRFIQQLPLCFARERHLQRDQQRSLLALSTGRT